MEKKEQLLEYIKQGITDINELAELMGYTGERATKSFKQWATRNGIEIPKQEKKVLFPSLREITEPMLKNVEVERMIQEKINQALAQGIHEAIRHEVKEALKLEQMKATFKKEDFTIPLGALSGTTTQKTIRVYEEQWRELDLFTSKYKNYSKTEIISYALKKLFEEFGM